LDVAVKNMTIAYNKLAQKAVKLNNSYLDLFKIYDEINDLPGLLPALTEAGTSLYYFYFFVSGGWQSMSYLVRQSMVWVTLSTPCRVASAIGPIRVPRSPGIRRRLHDRFWW
jgi:hypothetical protein